MSYTTLYFDIGNDFSVKSTQAGSKINKDKTNIRNQKAFWVNTNKNFNFLVFAFYFWLTLMDKMVISEHLNITLKVKSSVYANSILHIL